MSVDFAPLSSLDFYLFFLKISYPEKNKSSSVRYINNSPQTPSCTNHSPITQPVFSLFSQNMFPSFGLVRGGLLTGTEQKGGVVGVKREKVKGSAGGVDDPFSFYCYLGCLREKGTIMGFWDGLDPGFILRRGCGTEESCTCFGIRT